MQVLLFAVTKHQHLNAISAADRKTNERINYA
jgi:hypothetical protein